MGRIIITAGILAAAMGFSLTRPPEVSGLQARPIKLGTYTEPREHGVRDLFIHSPWDPERYAALSFPEHCWGNDLPNTSHDNAEPMNSLWRIGPDSSEAAYEYAPRPGVLFRARARSDSLAVRLEVEIVNHTAEPIKDIRSLICLKPDQSQALPRRPTALAEFRDTSFSNTWIAVDGKPVQLGVGTHYTGDLPDRGWKDLRTNINWGVNVKGGRDNRTIEDINWFRGNSPGRIVEEAADPPLIAIRSSRDENRWLAAIWYPARVLFCNPRNPCFHSDPEIPDCPAGDSVNVKGIIFFHEGSFESLLERTRAWIKAQ